MGIWILALTVMLLFATAITLFYSSMGSKRSFRSKALVTTLIWLLLYLGVLIGVSLKSTEQVLDLSEEKSFCGFYLDCHLRVSALEVRKMKTIGDGADAATARGVFYVVSVRVSSNARQAILKLKNPKAVVIDDQGNHYGRSSEAENRLEWAEHRSVPLVQAIAPNASFTKDLVFDIPASSQNPRLFFTEGPWMARLAELFLIGDEDSLLHKKTVFRLDPLSRQAHLRN